MNDSELEKAWEEALAVWGFNIWLSMPEFIDGSKTQELTSLNDLIAFTDLMTRDVRINSSAIEKFKLEKNITEIMAHEIGHHFKYPHTLQEIAALQVIQTKLMPDINAPMFINLFQDMLINEHIGNDPEKEKLRRESLAKIYENSLLIAAQESAKTGKNDIGMVFLFYLACYEKLWNMKIITHASRTKLSSFSPNYGQEAQRLVDNLWQRSGVYLKFIFFCSVFRKYLEQDAKNAGGKDKVIVVVGPGTCAKEYQPDSDDIDSVMSGAIAEAIAEALEKHEQTEIKEAKAKAKAKTANQNQKTKEQDNLDTINNLTKHRPGHDAAAIRKVLVSKHYQRLVNENILKLPASIKAMEKSIPSVLEGWDWGENIKAIDWTGTVQTQGPLAAIKPQQRDLIVDDGAPEYYDVPAIEIYVDTSGSMPNPQNSVNAMSLAAMILAASAIRHKGMVRSVIYSSGPYKVSEWMRDEMKSNEEFLFYYGGGTDYPFDFLQKSCKENKDTVRVIISDQDFLYNLSGDTYYKNKYGSPRDILMQGIEDSKMLVCMLHLPYEQKPDQIFAKELSKDKFRFVHVRNLGDYAKAAGNLAAALFDGYGK